MKNKSRLGSVVVIVVLMGCTLAPASFWLVPSPEQAFGERKDDSSKLSIHTWVLSTGSTPPMISAYVKVDCQDSVFIDLSEPRIQTVRGMMIADALTVWRVDRDSGKREHLISISGFTEEKMQEGRLSLDAGVYLAQVLFLLEFHRELRGTDIAATFDLGEVRSGNEEIILEGISFSKIEAVSPSFGVPPAGSRVR